MVSTKTIWTIKYQLFYGHIALHISSRLDKLVYGKEVVVPLHFKMNAEGVASILRYNLNEAKKERLHQLSKIKEQHITALHHQEVQKLQQKAWHLKKKEIKIDDLVLLYDSKVEEARNRTVRSIHNQRHQTN